MRLFIKLNLILLLFLSITLESFGYQRVIVLNTAVSPILKQLGVSSSIVGVTYNDHVFSHPVKIGSHLRPNPELMTALRPDLIIAGSKRAFPEKFGARFDAEMVRYDPGDLDDILASVAQFGRLFNRESQAEQIIAAAKQKLSRVHRPKTRATAIYEISQRPLKVAGQKNIISSVIAAAGGINIIGGDRKHVLISAEIVLVKKPMIYIFQNGPMNKNPEHPSQRSFFKPLHSQFLEVDQLAFTRPGLNAFDAVLSLNKIFNQLSQPE